MLKEYIYNGESEEELKEKLKNIFGESCLYARCKYESVKPPCGIIYVYDDVNRGWIADKAAFYGWNFMIVKNRR